MKKIILYHKNVENKKLSIVLYTNFNFAVMLHSICLEVNRFCPGKYNLHQLKVEGRESLKIEKIHSLLSAIQI